MRCAIKGVVEVCRVSIGRLFIHILYYTPVIGPRKAKKKKFTRGLSTADVLSGGDRLGLDYFIRSCAMADLFQFGRTILEGKYSERIFSGCPYASEFPPHKVFPLSTQATTGDGREKSMQ